MRHNKAVNHLGRKSGHRKAMLANMASSLIMHKRITTTVAKAKALKPYLEPLVTKSKEDTTHNRRIVFSYLKDKQAVAELFRTIAPKIMDRPGGYLRVLHVGFRKGDAADMALVEFVDFNEAALETTVKKASEKKTTRRSRSKKAAEAAPEAPAAEAPAAKASEADAAPEAPAAEASEADAAPEAPAAEAVTEPEAPATEAPAEEAPKSE